MPGPLTVDSSYSDPDEAYGSRNEVHYQSSYANSQHFEQGGYASPTMLHHGILPSDWTYNNSIHNRTTQIRTSHSPNRPDIEHSGSNPPCQWTAVDGRKAYDQKRKVQRGPDGRRLKKDGTANLAFRNAPIGYRYSEEEDKFFDAQGQEIFDCSRCIKWEAIDNFAVNHHGRHLLTCKYCYQNSMFTFSESNDSDLALSYSDSPPCGTVFTSGRKVYTMTRSPHSIKADIQRDLYGRRLKRDRTSNPKRRYPPTGSRYDKKEEKFFDAQGQEIFDCSTCRAWKSIDNFAVDGRGQHILKCKGCQGNYRTWMPQRKTRAKVISPENNNSDFNNEGGVRGNMLEGGSSRGLYFDGEDKEEREPIDE